MAKAFDEIEKKTADLNSEVFKVIENNWVGWVKTPNPPKRYYCIGWNADGTKGSSWIKLIPQCKCHAK